jgi:hypothetical protein
MKRVLALALAALVIPAAAFALDLTVGPRIGFGSYQVFSDDINDLLDAADGKRGFGPGFQAGVFAEIGLMPMLAVQPEVLFTHARPKLKYEIAGNDASFTFVSNTIDIPVLIKGKFDAGPVGATVFAGPVAQIKVGTWKTIDDDGTTETETDVPDDDLKTFAFGGVVGGGVEVPGLGPGNLMIDLRFFLGLTSFDDSSGGLDARSRAFQLGLGYGIDLM